MKKTTKKTLSALLAAFLAVLMTFSAVSCSGAGKTPDESEPLPTVSDEDIGAHLATFDRTVQIEPTVLVNEKDIKITATKISFRTGDVWGRLDLFLCVNFKIENNSSFSIMASPFPYVEVNGYTVLAYTGFEFDDMSAGKSGEGIMEISVSNLLAMGMTSVADLQFYIEVLDGDYHSVIESDILTLKTNKANSYKVDADSYRKAILSEGPAKDRGYTVVCSETEKMFEQNGISVLSGILVEWSEGPVLLLEVANETDALVFVEGELYLNGLIIDYRPAMSNRYIYPHSTTVIEVGMEAVMDGLDLEALGIPEIGKIGVLLAVENQETISYIVEDAFIELVVSGDVPEYSLTDVPYEKDNIKLYCLSCGFDEPSMMLMGVLVSRFVMENDSQTDVTLSLVSVEIDGVKYDPSEYIGNAMTIGKGDAAYGFLWSEALPETVNESSVKKVKVNFSIEDDQGQVIATPSITFGE